MHTEFWWGNLLRNVHLEIREESGIISVNSDDGVLVLNELCF